MVQLELPYDQQTNLEANAIDSKWPVKTFFEPVTHRIKVKPGRAYAEASYYLLVSSVGSVVHHWLLISKQLYPYELDQFTLSLGSYLQSEDNPEGVSLDEFEDAQGAVRFLNVMALEHGFGCHTSHRGDEITLNGKTTTVIHYVNVTIEDFDTAKSGVKWHHRRFVRV